MLKDITLRVKKEWFDMAKDNLTGHVGTHFDVMNKEFPVEYSIRKGYVFDVSGLKEIDINDIDLSKVEKDMFIGFYSGQIEKYEYTDRDYHTLQPVLTEKLIDILLDRNISLIGIDFPGIRKGIEHTPKDQYCADRNVFIIENLCGLSDIKEKSLTVYTFLMNFEGYSGLPCRVIAETGE